MRYIHELKSGDMVSDIYLCKSKQTLKTKAGKSMPCNPNFVYYKEKKGGKDRIVLTNGEVAVGTVQDYPEHATGFGYISHFATCEAAQMFRKKKKAAV